MIQEVLINLRNNFKFFIKLILLLTMLFSLISIFICTVFSYLQSIEKQKAQFGSTNYYELDEIVQQDTIEKVFSNYQYELFETINYIFTAELRVDNSDYKLIRPIINIIEIGNSPLNNIPLNIYNTYNAYEKDICLYGNLPSNSNEICLSFETFLNIQKTTNLLAISPNEIIGETISIYFPDLEQYIVNIKVVGILNYGCCELFDNNNVVYKIDSLDNLSNISKMCINRIYVANFSDIVFINENIEALNLNSCIQYKGTQYGIYLQLTAFGEIASTIFLLIAIPLVIMLLFVCLIMLNNFYKNQRKLFTEMLLVGYTPKKLVQFVILELLFCVFFTFIFSVTIGILSVYLIRYIFSSMLIDIVFNVNSAFISSVLLSILLTIFIALSLLFIRHNIKNPDLYLLTK